MQLYSGAAECRATGNRQPGRISSQWNVWVRTEMIVDYDVESVRDQKASGKEPLPRASVDLRTEIASKGCKSRAPRVNAIQALSQLSYSPKGKLRLGTSGYSSRPRVVELAGRRFRDAVSSRGCGAVIEARKLL
jgi:hypothetical protein